ncbi:MAG: transcriptional repressor LexA [Clostridia bacterium]|nr:transcriptional repressor LexA [Clostridia bacterium]
MQELYKFTVEYSENNGFPPSVREICSNLNIKSTATAYSYIEKLKNKGLLNKDPAKKRAIPPTNKLQSFISVPILGEIRAGSPIFAVENLEGYCPLPADFKSGDDEFALRVTGDSMINAGIFDNDLIIVRKCENADNGNIVVALIEDSATVKRFYKKNGKIVLHPENDEMQDMIFDDVRILGIVKGLIRKF